MFAGLGNFNQQQGNFSGFQPQQVYGYSNEPVRTSSINIDDIIIALQNARDAKFKLEQHIAALKENMPKPIDLNKSTTCYLVAHKTFASGKVWQPDTPLLPNENIARFELNRLLQTNPSVDYRISKVEWFSPEDAPREPTSKQFKSYDIHGSTGSTWEFPQSSNNGNNGNNGEGDEVVSSSCDKEDGSPAEERRFVVKPRSKKADKYGFPNMPT